MLTVTRSSFTRHNPGRLFFLFLLVAAALLVPHQLWGAAPPCTLDPTQPSVTICTPAANATVGSPVHVVAGSNANPVATLIQIYLDGSKVYQVAGAQLDTNITTSPGTHRLTVQAYNGSNFKSTISITVSGVSVTVQPSNATLVPGAQQQLTATVQSSSDTSVTWAVDDVSGGNATVGTIDPSGLYTAPSTTGNHVVKATATQPPASAGPPT